MAGTFAPLMSLRRSALALVVAAVPLAAQAQGRGPDKIADVAEAVIDAVVNISTSQTMAGGGSTPRSENRQQEGRPQVPPGSPFEEFFEEFFKNRRGQATRRANARRGGSTRSAPAS
jgi:serine protease Do